MAAMLKTALAAIAVFTAAASCWLFVMYLVLRHPGYQAGASMAAIFVAQSVLTLVLVASDGPARSSGRPAGPQAVQNGLRLVVLAGACGIAWAGYSAVSSTLSGPHFEGFALVIGAALVMQGLLTLLTFARQLPLFRLTANL
jgi:hypothetical protein